MILATSSHSLQAETRKSLELPCFGLSVVRGRFEMHSTFKKGQVNTHYKTAIFQRLPKSMKTGLLPSCNCNKEFNTCCRIFPLINKGKSIPSCNHTIQSILGNDGLEKSHNVSDSLKKRSIFLAQNLQLDEHEAQNLQTIIT